MAGHSARMEGAVLRCCSSLGWQQAAPLQTRGQRAITQILLATGFWLLTPSSGEQELIRSF
jgi:hypothetical protein